MAVAEVVVEVHPQPPPAVALRNLVVPKVVQYLYLASAWVAFAGMAVATVARRALGVDSPLTDAFVKVSFGSLVFPALVIVVLTLKLFRAMCAVGFRSSLRTSAKVIQFKIQARRKMFGGLTWKLLGNPAVLMMLVTFLFLLLLGAGALVLEGVLPVEESRREKIGYALFDSGVLGTTAMFCFVILPRSALKVWRSK